MRVGCFDCYRSTLAQAKISREKTVTLITIVVIVSIDLIARLVHTPVTKGYLGESNPSPKWGLLREGRSLESYQQNEV